MSRHNDALLSPCGTWRYWLTRSWDDALAPLVVIGLNPSTADAENDDPTIRRCIAFAKREGAGGLVMLNLFAFRATDPKEMKAVALASAERAIGPENDAHIMAQCAGARVVYAWGAHGKILNRDYRIHRLIRPLAHSTLCLGKTQAGLPRHPLYLAANTPLEAFA